MGTLADFGADKGIWIALILGIAVLVGALFSGGRPTDIGKPRWQLWVVGGLVMIGLLFFLSRSISDLSYSKCTGSSYQRC